MRIVAAVVIATPAMLTVVYAGSLTKGVVRMEVSSSENGVLYVFALFPDGFGEIAKFRVRCGERNIAVNIAELKFRPEAMRRGRCCWLLWRTGRWLSAVMANYAIQAASPAG